jgi:hypothetical protein
MKVAVDCRVSRKSFRRATHAAWMGQASFQALIGLMALLFASASFALGVGVSPSAQMPVVAYLLVAVLFWFLYPTFVYAKDPLYRQDIHFEFNREGVRYTRAGSESSLLWSSLNQARETAEFYILEPAGRLRLAVPKSAFGPDQEQRFRLIAATSGVPIRR